MEIYGIVELPSVWFLVSGVWERQCGERRALKTAVSVKTLYLTTEALFDRLRAGGGKAG